MREVAALVGAVALLSLQAAGAQPWQPEEFPISYWCGPPVAHNTLDDWKAVAGANFTVAGPGWGYSVAETHKMLDFCRQVGIKAMITDPRIRTEMVDDDDWQARAAAVVKEYGGHPALYGYYVRDEPGSEAFPALAQITAALLQADPRHLPYINLFPTYASVQQLGAPTYADHLDRYLATVKPLVLSYDHYCLMKDGTDRPDYFENLGLIREYGLRYHTPPWNIVLSWPHLGYRDPSDAELRWQVYTSLAYGMKGLMYFTYWTLDEMNGGLAIVDREGKPTKRYAALRQVNGEMRVLGKILLGLESTGVYHTGDIPPGCTRAGTDLPLALPADKPLVLGLFRGKEGDQWAMVVNRDHDRPAEVSLRLKPPVVGLSAVSPTDGARSDVPAPDGRIALQLAAGDGRLFRLRTQFTYPELPKPLAAIDFRFGKDAEGWGSTNSLAPLQAGGGVLRTKVTGPDPSLCRGALRVPAGTYSEIQVRMKLKGADTAQLFWATKEEPQFSDTKYLNFPVNGDGEFHDYVIPVGTHAKWKGHDIRAIRFDPTVGGCVGEAVEIAWVRGK